MSKSPTFFANDAERRARAERCRSRRPPLTLDLLSSHLAEVEVRLDMQGGVLHEILGELHDLRDTVDANSDSCAVLLNRVLDLVTSGAQEKAGDTSTEQNPRRAR